MSRTRKEEVRIIRNYDIVENTTSYTLYLQEKPIGSAPTIAELTHLYGKFFDLSIYEVLEEPEEDLTTAAPAMYVILKELAQAFQQKRNKAALREIMGRANPLLASVEKLAA